MAGIDWKMTELMEWSEFKIVWIKSVNDHMSGYFFFFLGLLPGLRLGQRSLIHLRSVASG